MLSVLAALAVLLQADAAPPVALKPSRLLATPDWIRRPTSDDLVRFYPEPAGKHGLSGRAVMSCKVTDDGTLTACGIDSELPRAEGFGEAALRMAPLFRMRPETTEGESVGGGTVQIPIRFVTGGGAERHARLVSAMDCYGHVAHLAEGAPTTPGAWPATVFWSLEVGAAAAAAGLRPSGYEDALAIAHREAAKSRRPDAAQQRDTCLAKAKARKP